MRESKVNLRIVEAYNQGYRATSDGKIFSPAGKQLALFRKSKRAPYLQFSVRIQRNNLFRGGNGIESNVNRCNIDVHRFIAYTIWGDDSFSSPVIRHLDDDKSNNKQENLAMGTYKDNSQDAIRNDIRRRGLWTNELEEVWQRQNLVTT